MFLELKLIVFHFVVLNSIFYKVFTLWIMSNVVPIYRFKQTLSSYVYRVTQEKRKMINSCTKIQYNLLNLDQYYTHFLSACMLSKSHLYKKEYQLISILVWFWFYCFVGKPIHTHKPKTHNMKNQLEKCRFNITEWNTCSSAQETH